MGELKDAKSIRSGGTGTKIRPGNRRGPRGGTAYIAEKGKPEGNWALRCC